MGLCSLSFVYLFLPATIVLYALSPVRLRALTLLVISGVFYLWLEGDNILLLAGVILFDYAMTRLMCRCGEFPRLQRAIMICAVTKSVALIAFYNMLYAVAGTHIPLGLGVFCLTSAGYVIDCYHGYQVCEKSPVEFALITAFFPKLYAGPLVYYGRVVTQVKNPRMSLSKIGSGAGLFIQGLSKKVILGDIVLGLYRQLKAIPLYETTVLTMWMLVLMLAFAVYFILSGLCDMARGLGLIFGFELPDNFIYPYRATSINDFFARFNVTVNRFIRRYVYFNLGGAQGSVPSGVFNILFATILMGLWFGISLNLVVWGVYFAAFIVFERYVLLKHLEAIPTLFKWLYSTVVVLVSYAIFAGDTLSQTGAYLKVMFGIGEHAAFDSTILYLLTSNYLVLIACALCSVGFLGYAGGFFKKNTPLLWEIVSVVVNTALLIVSTAFML